MRQCTVLKGLITTLQNDFAKWELFCMIDVNFFNKWYSRLLYEINQYCLQLENSYNFDIREL